MFSIVAYKKSKNIFKKYRLRIRYNKLLKYKILKKKEREKKKLSHHKDAGRSRPFLGERGILPLVVFVSSLLNNCLLLNNFLLTKLCFQSQIQDIVFNLFY